MQNPPHDTDGLRTLTLGITSYLHELEDNRQACLRHADTAAIHTRGEELQVYRLFNRSEETCKSIRRASDMLPGWKESPFWKAEGKAWQAIQEGVLSRMEKHKELLPICTEGISWEGRPMLVHAYKFEADPVMKVELVLPQTGTRPQGLPLQVIADALRCHECLVPPFVAVALPPYERHEAKFQTITEYLSQKMPKELYASQCFPPSRLHDYS